ncbi:hypothetical protein G7Y89_g2151 [Cudoniella acicularis]|uniref:N-acetyltransferase domain-containing protein n=1 Tax=Cudoniella acicularis TaxID=354080 RepID=A0A8H4RVV1_9HELO|nr:hypothetical protein G7Y89_g2151 [Cudoniella acicularis]
MFQSECLNERKWSVLVVARIECVATIVGDANSKYKVASSSLRKSTPVHAEQNQAVRIKSKGFSEPRPADALQSRANSESITLGCLDQSLRVSQYKEGFLCTLREDYFGDLGMVSRMPEQTKWIEAVCEISYLPGSEGLRHMLLAMALAVVGEDVKDTNLLRAGQEHYSWTVGTLRDALNVVPFGEPQFDVTIITSFCSAMREIAPNKSFDSLLQRLHGLDAIFRTHGVANLRTPTSRRTFNEFKAMAVTLCLLSRHTQIIINHGFQIAMLMEALDTAKIASGIKPKEREKIIEIIKGIMSQALKIGGCIERWDVAIRDASNALRLAETRLAESKMTANDTATYGQHQCPGYEIGAALMFCEMMKMFLYHLLVDAGTFMQGLDTGNDTLGLELSKEIENWQSRIFRAAHKISNLMILIQDVKWINQSINLFTVFGIRKGMARHVPQLDLRNNWGGSAGAITIADRMNTLPGFKTSAAFFTFLRANLVLPTSTLNSNTSTPLLNPYSSQTVPPLYSLPPSSLSTMSFSTTESSTAAASSPPSNPLDEIPALTTKQLTTDKDKIAALKLIADSIAQQRQIGSTAVIFHPLTIAVYIAILAITSRIVYKAPNDLGILATTCGGITMACLIAIRGLSSGYLAQAEEMKWSFIENEDGEEDVVIGSRYGEEIIGACVLRLERNPPSPGSKKKGSKSSGKTGGKGIVRAWTVRIRYRGKGVGTELLEEAVKIAKEKLGGSPEIGFAKEHANSKMLLPEVFNSVFRKREVKAAKLLESVVEYTDGAGIKKKR